MRNAGEGIHRSPVGAALGFLVADPDLNPISANEEAIAILTYPSKQAHEESIAEAFNKKIRSRLPPGSSRKQVSAIIQFKSGRRTYFCRAFPLDGNGRVFNSPAVLLVLERGMSGAFAVSQIAQQFHLTQREQETVTLLLRGLCNKEIADGLGISANTVKNFLRLVMLKMQVTSRSEIVSRILNMLLSPGGTGAD
jgi:DNA-binding NarL/FixJ family response regulator